MRVRAKISYTALLKRMTIVELFCTTIQRVFFQLQKEDYYPKYELI